MADGDWEWMTPGECADWWNGLFQSRAQRIAEKASGVPYVGFYVSWASYSAADAADLLFLDNLRLGRGLQDAVDNPEGKGLFGRGLSVVADVGRAAFFVPVGRVAKTAVMGRGGGKAGTVAVEEAARLPGPHAPAPKSPPMRAGGDAVARGNPSPEVNGLFRKMFYFHDPAPGRGICWFVSLGQALRHTGRYWIKLDDLLNLFPSIRNLASLDGKLARLETIGHFDFGNMARYLHELNVSFRPLGKVASLQELMRVVGPKPNGAVLFGIRWIHPVEGECAHALYMALRPNGRLAIFDRSGIVVESFAEFERLAIAKGWKGYRGIAHANLLERAEPILVYNARVVETTWAALKAGYASGLFGALALEIKVISAMFDPNRR
ncbi:hypothetical protein M0638_01310 [Roseomonas sp. NAR14]|uniref:Uncharacterized protein n=1 Tax=Roseomonas acroporae TaxID=2937791 RepID=A0A9X1Y3Z9_9PROT|nr:hypothetical protein [Roseomonas acroporae]MCK8783018.1 hypothetical protein [Roseomonas acroporae]